MKLQNLSTRTFVRLIVEGASLTTILLLFLLYVFTKDIRVILGGFSVMILLFFWGVIFLHYFQKKLSVFTDGLCRTLDEMMDSTVRPQINYEAETLLARISHRLERLYHVMQETRHKVEEEKAELQSLVSDISHQTKTPIANLKMLNDTMLARNISEETREEFLHATASQLDKLDFLIQGMVKTSRLETGVITLEKKETVIADTLVDAINGVLAPMERKHLHLSVDCPENLTVSHDSRWTSEALFNLLDNAVEACSRQTKGKRRILAVGEIRGNMYFLKIENTYDGLILPEEKTFRSRKGTAADHGIGLSSVRRILENHGGDLDLVPGEETFLVGITIECPFISKSQCVI